MVLVMRFLFRMFGKGNDPSRVKVGTRGKPIACLNCNKAFAVKNFPATNGVCPRCGHDHFSFLTDEIPDADLAANDNLSDGAKFVLDAADNHIREIRGRMLIQYLRNHDLV